MGPTIIDRLYKDNRELVDYLKSKDEPSYQNGVEDHFRKTLLLSTASYFEANLKEILIDFFQERTNRSEILVRFIQNKAIERQYHTFFSWQEKNANAFFGLFGDGFKIFMKAEVKGDANLDESIKAFLKLGNSRNELVHGNFANFPLESTAEEVYALYKQASFFIETLPVKLREYAERENAP